MQPTEESVYFDQHGNRVVFAPPPPATKTNGFAVASMVLGILWIYWIGSVLALIFGYKATREIAESRETQTGAGMAKAGIVLGWVGVGTFAALVAFFAIARLAGVAE